MMKMYRNPYDLINDVAPVILNILAEDEQDYLRHVLDFEWIDLHMHDGVVDIVDAIDGTVYNTQPVFEHIRDSIKFAMHDCERDS